MATDIAILAVDVNVDVTTAVGAGVFGMLVALFTLFVRAMFTVGHRIDQRSDAEMARKDAELVAKDAEVVYWRDLYLGELRNREREA